MSLLRGFAPAIPFCRAAALALLGTVGCAHGAKGAVTVDELNVKLEALRTQNATYAKQVEELENRVFILTDQLDSRNVESERVASPQLPRVTLHADAGAEDGASPCADDPTIECEGEAAKRSTNRPLLRLNGDETPVLSSRRARDNAPAAPPAEKPIEIVREGTRARAAAPRAAGMDAFELYRTGYEGLRGGRHEDAAASFRAFLQQHAGHELADNAQYWLAETFYDRKDYPAAVREFRRVVERYARGNKVPDALLKIGFSYLALGSSEAGRQTLEQLVRSYPRHPAASLATTRLSELGKTSTLQEGR